MTDRRLSFKYYSNVDGVELKLCQEIEASKTESNSNTFLTLSDMADCPTISSSLTGSNALIWNQVTIILEKFVSRVSE